MPLQKEGQTQMQPGACLPQPSLWDWPGRSALMVYKMSSISDPATQPLSPQPPDIPTLHHQILLGAQTGPVWGHASLASDCYLLPPGKATPASLSLFPP